MTRFVVLFKLVRNCKVASTKDCVGAAVVSRMIFLTVLVSYS